MDRVEPLYMLDTNIMSYLMERPGSERLAHCQERLDSLTGPVAISVIVQAEIFAGLEKKHSNRKELRLRELMREIRVEYLDRGLWFSDLYACIRSASDQRGQRIEQFDAAIAAHAMALGATLISKDKGLARVGGLKLESWDVPGISDRQHAPRVSEPAAAYLSRLSDTRFGWAETPTFWMTGTRGATYVGAHAR